MAASFVLGVCQTPVVRTWVDLKPYLEKAGQAGPGLFLLPELAVGGFDYASPEQWAEQSEALLGYLVSLGQESGACFMGSLWEKRQGQFYNALKLAGPDGVVPMADKYHLFPLSDEPAHFAPGQIPARTLALGPAKVAGAVCFDLRFPEVFRMHASQDATVLAVCAQWPASRLTALRILLRARAVENQAYVLFANACLEAPGLGQAAGHSSLLDPSGEVIFELGANPAVKHSPYDPKAIRQARLAFDSRHARFEILPPWK